MKYICLFFLLIMLSLDATAKQHRKDETADKRKCKQIHLQWLRQCNLLTRHCVGFSAPVSARAMAYISVGMYESHVEWFDTYRSLSGQLSHYQRSVWAGSDDQLVWAYIANRVDYELILYFYQNMPPGIRREIEAVYQRNEQISSSKRKGQQLSRSAVYARQLAQEIIEWSKRDGGDGAYNSNYPSSYEAPQCASCWTKTVPGYLNALQPYWGTHTMMLSSNETVCDTMPALEYSTDTSGLMHRNAMEVFKMQQQLPLDKEIIAKYWDDGPGVSGTPSGHLFALAVQLCSEDSISLEETMALFVSMGVAMNDAFIACWRLKYKFNLLRPITYIQRHIQADFNTVIDSPPFPEYPSGHSYQSGAATVILNAFLGETLNFTDRTHLERTDIDGTPRSFRGFDEMAREISLSRFYGGIHYPYTLLISLEYGKKIGSNTLQYLKLKK